MKLFAELIDDISRARDDNYTQRLLIHYFTLEETSAEKNEALKLLFDICPKKSVSSRQLKSWASDLTGYPNWLIERSEKEAGNFLKTFALLLNTTKSQSSNRPLTYWLATVSELSQSEQEIAKFIGEAVVASDSNEILLLLKLMTGTFKSPTSELEIYKVLSQIWSIDPSILSLRKHKIDLIGQNLIPGLLEPIEEEQMVVPKSFPKYEIFESQLDTLGEITDWEAFGHQQGLEVQLIKHGKSVHLWTSEGLIITDKFPEIENTCVDIQANFVIYGKLIPNSKTSSHEQIKSRLNKKKLSKKDLQLGEPLLVALEILRLTNYSKDSTKKSFINSFKENPNIQFIKNLHFTSWDDLRDLHNKCREFGFTGICLKRKMSAGKYLIWKATTYAIKAVLIYVELDPGERSGIKFMTFGLRKEAEIIPIAKVSKVDKSIDLEEIFMFVKTNTIERFGPIRTIKPSLVYELHFDTITSAPRRKSGLKLSNVLITKKIDDNIALADEMKTLKKMT